MAGSYCGLNRGIVHRPRDNPCRGDGCPGGMFSSRWTRGLLLVGSMTHHGVTLLHTD